MVWQPAEGGEAVSAAEWSHAAEEQTVGGDPPAAGDAAAEAVAVDPVAQPATAAATETPADGGGGDG